MYTKFNLVLAASVMSIVYMAGISGVANAVVNQTEVTSDAKSQVVAIDNGSLSSISVLPEPNADGQRRYIVRLSEPAVAMYSGEGQFEDIPRDPGGRINTSSPITINYVTHLENLQETFLNSLTSVLGRDIAAIKSFQYAYNGIAVELTDDEASIVKNSAGVAEVILSRNYFLDTDVGPQLIGASNLWGSMPTSSDVIFVNGFEEVAAGTFGEGIVIATLDTGINFDHPTFAATGGDGYVHTNPLGAGNYLGVCDPTNADQFISDYTCNDKLIGGFDFVNGLVPADGFDIEGPEDEDGHGSHTASTSGGNVVTSVEINGISDITISGVAPHATVLMFDVCFTNADGRGECPSISAIEAVDQIIADGLVDVINFSIGGGTSPWLDPVSQAFLSATGAGVFVATSAGNSGPGAGTLGHVEPWTSSSGASTHNRLFATSLSITGPAPVDSALENIIYGSGNGPEITDVIVATVNYAGVVDAANIEGCSPFPAASFDAQVALISRGSCSFADKVNNAQTAGAVAVIVHNNEAGSINMVGLEATTIPAVSILQADGVAMAAFITDNPTATIQIDHLTVMSLTEQADVMAAFSSRGPSPFEYNKPDVTAPGVSILAAVSDSDAGPSAEYGLISGTSMASPHNAGAAALLKELKPSWTAPEIKSALMMTAKTVGVTKEGGATAANPLDRGAGRIQVDIAAKSGLVMDETAINFQAANPDTGGDPKTLNVPNLTDFACIGTCTFQRGFRSVSSTVVNYEAQLLGIAGVVSPDTFTLNPGQIVILNIEVDGVALPEGDTSFGELVITEIAIADSFSTAPAVAIPDDGYDGTLDSMACSTVTVSGVTNTSIDASLELGIDHTWVGDLVIKLQNPDGDILGVMSRPVFDEPADDGTFGPGDPSNLLATFPITFIDTATESAETLGAETLGGTNGVVCQDGLICDFSSAPDTIAQPPSNFAGLLTGTINGDWNICVGDSAAEDSGTVETITLNIIDASVATGPRLHLPAVIIGFPEQPDIEVTPTSLSVTLDTDMTDDQIITISNEPTAGADLNWVITDDGSVLDINVFEQVSTGTGDGIVSDFFDDGTIDAGAYSADAMTFANDVTIEKMFFDGFVGGVDPLSSQITAMTVTIYADAAGVPAGQPEDGGGTELFTITLPVGDANLDLGADTGTMLVDILGANGTALDLAAGTYWVTVFVNFTGTQRWNWFAGVSSTALNGQIIDPTDIFEAGFLDWTDLTTLNPVFAGLAFNASTSSTCGAPWVSFSNSGSAIVPSDSLDVTVTFDSTGLAPGDYSASICVDSDDPDEARVVVPVNMTVN